MAPQDPFVAPQLQQSRRAALGLNDPAVTKFTTECEFISLGCYCAPSYALQALGLKRYSYPFDWVRSPAEGVIQCLNNGFADFLTYSAVRSEGPHGKFFADTRWGGSFWHHDLNEPKVRSDFARRIDRLLGRKEVPASTPRVFVWSVNSTSELDATLRLHDALRRVVPAAKIFLLVLIDFQCTKGAMTIEGQDSNILFYRIPESLTRNSSTIQSRSEVYFDAIALAARFWAGRAGDVARVPHIQHISLACDPFDGGNPGSELYAPRRVQRTPVASLTPRSPPQGLASMTSSNIAAWDQLALPPSPAGSSCSSSPRSIVRDVSTASLFSSASTVASPSSLPGGAQRHLESWKIAQMSPVIAHDRGTECASSWSQGSLLSPHLSQQNGSVMSTNPVTRQSGPIPSVSAPSNLAGYHVHVSQAF